MHKEIASKTLTSQLLELGTDTMASESVRTQVFEVMETLSREFRNDPSLRQVEDTFNRLKQTDPSMIPPAVPQKHQITEQERQQEEAELKRVLALSLEESQEDPRYYSQTGGSFSSNMTSQPSQSNRLENDFFQQQAPGRNQQSTQPQPQKQPQVDLLSQDTTPQPATGKNVSTVSRVRAIYDLTSEEPGELTFHRGDVITVIESVYRDWWKGSLRGEIGIFPLNYVTPISDPTPQELAQEARDEQMIYAEAQNIEKILNQLHTAEKQNPRPKIAENEELQDLYTSTQAIRPKLVKLIEKLTQKREDLIDLDKKLMSARSSYDGLLDGSLGHVQPPQSSTNPFNKPSGPPQQPPQNQSNFSPAQGSQQLQPPPVPSSFSPAQGSGPGRTSTNPTDSTPQGFPPTYSVNAPPGGPSNSGFSGNQGYNAGSQSGSQGSNFPPPSTSPVHQQSSPQGRWSQAANPQGSYGQGTNPGQVPPLMNMGTGPSSSFSQGQGQQNQGVYPGQYSQGQPNLINMSNSSLGPGHNQQTPQSSYGGFKDSSRPPIPQQQQQQQQGYYKPATETEDAASFIIPAGTGMDDPNFAPQRNQYSR